MAHKLNKHVVASIKPDDREKIVWNADVPGLGLLVTSAGAKSFILKTRIGSGRTAPVKKPTLDKVGELTLDQARIKASEWKALAKDGVDLSRFKEETGCTIADLCDRYLDVMARHTVFDGPLIMRVKFWKPLSPDGETENLH